MSSSGKTYFVVAYDHDDETFAFDDQMTEYKFEHDTYDSVEEGWCNLNSNLDMWQDIESLTQELKEKLND